MLSLRVNSSGGVSRSARSGVGRLSSCQFTARRTGIQQQIELALAAIANFIQTFDQNRQLAGRLHLGHQVIQLPVIPQHRWRQRGNLRAQADDLARCAEQSHPHGIRIHPAAGYPVGQALIVDRAVQVQQPGVLS